MRQSERKELRSLERMPASTNGSTAVRHQVLDEQKEEEKKAYTNWYGEKHYLKDDRENIF